jgi:NTE family protein
MSSGFFGFFAHAGVLAVLEGEGLLPVRAAGSSAGALVTGAWASGRSAREIEAELLGLRRRDFWDPSPGPGLLRGTLFRARLDALLGVKSIEECRIPVAFSVFDFASRSTRVLRDGPLAVAIQASCTVPVLFHPVRHDGRVLFDGGILDRPGMAGIPPGNRVLYHHLTSRSPWRMPGDPALRIPRAKDLVTLVVDGLPRSGPFRLENGHRAFAVARDATQRALDRPIVDGVVRV